MHWLLLFALMLTLACGDATRPGTPTVTVSPLLDSLFVGDTVAPGAFNAVYRDAGGVVVPATVRWRSTNLSVVTVDSVTGRVVGQGRGIAEIQASANGVTGRSLVVVARSLEVTLLLDTIYLMPGDTFTIPVDVRRKGGSPPPVRFAPSPNPPVYTVDTVTGKVTAVGNGLARLVARADTVADTGAVEVIELTDTVGGKAFFTFFGSIIHHSRAAARGLNYARVGGTHVFRLDASITTGGVTIENVVLTLLAPVTAAGVYPIDTISPAEAFASGNAPVCSPPRPWGVWSTRTSSLELAAVSRTGTISIARVVPIPHGAAISGSFRFDAQRTDLYGDPLGMLPLRGTFVAPLVTDLSTCGN